MAKVIYVPENKEFEVEEGTSILEACLSNGIDIEHACGGYCACSTCHVIVSEGFENLNEQEDEEFDRLDRAKGVTLKSRLSCQALIQKGTVKVDLP